MDFLHFSRVRHPNLWTWWSDLLTNSTDNSHLSSFENIYFLENNLHNEKHNSQQNCLTFIFLYFCLFFPRRFQKNFLMFFSTAQFQAFTHYQIRVTARDGKTAAAKLASLKKGVKYIIFFRILHTIQDPGVFTNRTKIQVMGVIMKSAPLCYIPCHPQWNVVLHRISLLCSLPFFYERSSS